MLVGLLWLVALISALVLALGLTPVRVSVRAQSEPTLRLRVGAAPLGGLIPTIPIYDSTRPRRPKARKRPKRGGRQTRRRPSGGGFSGATARAFLRLLRELFAVVRFDHLHLEALYGLGDPADTGAVWGWLAALSGIVAARPGVTVALRPDFERAVFAGELDAAVRITPAALLPPALRFAWALRGIGR